MKEKILILELRIFITTGGSELKSYDCGHPELRLFVLQTIKSVSMQNFDDEERA